MNQVLERIWSISLIGGWLPKVLLGLTLIGIVLLVILSIICPQETNANSRLRSNANANTSSKPNSSRLRTIRWVCIGAITGLVAGFGITWLLDHYLVFGVMLGMDVIIAAAWSVMLVGVAIALSIITHSWRKVLAIVTTVLAVCSTATQINEVYGEYPTLGSVVDITSFEPLDLSRIGKATQSAQQWREHPTQAPKQGMVGSVNIPATASGFKARTAVVYVPPAGLVPHAVRLPVLIMMAGQPGSPDRAFLAGQLPQIANQYAQQHHGLAPVIVAPDQLGSALHNTLCVNSTKYGNVETYITKDVTDWIVKYLPVSKQPQHWAIAGFSQGATCAVQFGLRYPERYGHIIASSSELGPHNGNETHMIRDFFNGDAAAYRAHVPLDILHEHMHDQVFAHSTLVMGAGTLDSKSINNAKTITNAARLAGMRATAIIVPDTGHDWHTVQATLRTALPTVCAQMGLDYPIPTLKDTAATTGVRVVEQK